MKKTTTYARKLHRKDAWQRKTQREADRQNSAYDRYGMGNTPETVDPLGSKMVAELRTQRARITELESQLAQRFDAADMATAAAQGFRDGVASLSANAGEPVAWQYRSLRDNGAWFDCTKERFEMRCTQPEIWETRALYAAPPTSAEGVEHG